MTGSSPLDHLSQQTELAIVTRSEADALILALSGELDLDSSSLLEQEIEAGAANGSPHLVIDLSGLEFIDSSGLRTLLRAHERARERDLRFSLIRGGPTVHRVFELTRMDEIFTFEG